MVKATNASIVTIGLVFLSLIFSIVGIVTPFMICNNDLNNNKKYFIYKFKQIINGKTDKLKIKCNENLKEALDFENKVIETYCSISQTLSGIFLGLISILFLLSLVILFTGYTKILRVFCIVVNALLLVINICLIVSLSLYYAFIEINIHNHFHFLKINISIGPTIIMLALNIIVIIGTLISFSSLKTITKKPTF